jgi:phage terminase Nu1 subunit (DNA packaging protein)
MAPERDAGGATPAFKSLQWAARGIRDVTETMNTNALANLLGLSTRAVRALAARGIVIRRTARGKFRVAESVRGYCAHLREIAAGRGGEEAVLELSAERAKLAHEQTIGHALKNASLRGELVEASAVEREWGDALRLVRAGMLALPSRVQQRLNLVAADVAVIDREVRDLLMEIGNGDFTPESTPKILRRVEGKSAPKDRRIQYEGEDGGRARQQIDRKQSERGPAVHVCGDRART